MTRTLSLVGLLSLSACGGNATETPIGVPDDNTPTPQAQPVAFLNGSITDSSGTQARLAGPGTLAATTSVRVNTLTGTDLGTVDVIDGAFRFGLLTLPADAFLTVDALNASGDILGSVVVETPADVVEYIATPLTTETSVEALVFADLGYDAAKWAEIRNRVDIAVATAVAAEADVDVAIHGTAVAIDAAYASHLDAWTAAGADLTAMQAAQYDASIALSAALANGSTTAHATFNDALLEIERGQGLTGAVLVEAESVAHASLRTGIQASAVASTVTLETVRASAIAESEVIQAQLAVEAALIADVDLEAVLQSSFADLQLALEGATSVAEVQAAVEAWRDGLLASIQGDLSTGIDILDQILALFNEFVTDLQSALDNLQATLETTIVDLAGTNFDGAALAAQVGAAFDAQQAELAIDLAELEAELATAIATISMSFPGL